LEVGLANLKQIRGKTWEEFKYENYIDGFDFQVVWKLQDQNYGLEGKWWTCCKVQRVSDGSVAC